MIHSIKRKRAIRQLYQLARVEAWKRLAYAIKATHNAMLDWLKK